MLRYSLARLQDCKPMEYAENWDFGPNGFKMTPDPDRALIFDRVLDLPESHEGLAVLVFTGELKKCLEIT